MIFYSKCDRCGSEVKLDDTRGFMFCWKCGNKIFITPGQSQSEPAPATEPVIAPVPPQQPAPQPVPQPVPVVMPAPVVNYVPQRIYTGPNLYIYYQSAHPNVLLIAVIRSTGQRFRFSHGQGLSFNLAPGNQELILKIGKRSYRRDVLLPADGSPVRIDCSWSGGTARINISNGMGGNIQSFY